MEEEDLLLSELDKFAEKWGLRGLLALFFLATLLPLIFFYSETYPVLSRLGSIAYLIFYEFVFLYTTYMMILGSSLLLMYILFLRFYKVWNRRSEKLGEKFGKRLKNWEISTLENVKRYFGGIASFTLIGMGVLVLFPSFHTGSLILLWGMIIAVLGVSSLSLLLGIVSLREARKLGIGKKQLESAYYRLFWDFGISGCLFIVFVAYSGVFIGIFISEITLTLILPNLQNIFHLFLMQAGYEVPHHFMEEAVASTRVGFFSQSIQCLREIMPFVFILLIVTSIFIIGYPILSLKEAKKSIRLIVVFCAAVALEWAAENFILRAFFLPSNLLTGAIVALIAALLSHFLLRDK